MLDQSTSEVVENSVDWIEIISLLWLSRRLIGIFTGLATIAAVVVSLILSESYKSTAIILPESERSKLAALGGLSDLAALAGVSVGTDASLAKLYPAIIKSEAVLKNVIYAKYQTTKSQQPANLVDLWRISADTELEKFEVCLRRLRGDLDVSVDNRISVVTISIETMDPGLSADIVNKITTELDSFIRTKRTTNAGEQRKWIDARLTEVKQDLEKSENQLREFREKNRRVSDSPQLLIEQGRLSREVEINSTLYVELKKQFEIAKIEEIKNVPIINILDAARPAATRESPKRKNIVLATFFVSSLSSMLLIIVWRRYRDKLGVLKSIITKRPIHFEEM